MNVDMDMDSLSLIPTTTTFFFLSYSNSNETLCQNMTQHTTWNQKTEPNLTKPNKQQHILWNWQGILLSHYSLQTPTTTTATYYTPLLSSYSLFLFLFSLSFMF